MKDTNLQIWVTLTVLGRDTATWVVPPGESIMVGRDESANDLVLHHPNVSRTHARLVNRGSSYAIMDLASTKGSFVNRVRVRGTQQLEDGDMLRIGPYALRISVKRWQHADEEDGAVTISDTTSLPYIPPE